MDSLGKIIAAVSAIVVLIFLLLLGVAAVVYSGRGPTPAPAPVVQPYYVPSQQKHYCTNCDNYVTPLTYCPRCLKRTTENPTPRPGEYMPTPNVRPGSQTGSTIGDKGEKK